METELTFFPELLYKNISFYDSFFLLYNLFLLQINLIVNLNFLIIMNFTFPPLKSIVFFTESNFHKECIFYG